MVEPMDLCFYGPEELVATDEEPQRFTLECEFPEGLRAGTALKLVLTGYRTVATSGWEIKSVQVTTGDGAIEIDSIVPESFEDRFLSRVIPDHYALSTMTITEALAPGAEIEFEVDGTPSAYTGVNPTLGPWIRYPDRDTFEPATEPKMIRIVPGSVDDLRLQVTPEPTADGTHSGTIFAIDAHGNPVETYSGAISLTADDGIGGIPDQVRATASNGGRCDLEGIHVTGDGPQRITAVDEERDLETTSTALFSTPVGGWGHYFGGIHFHTRYSHDGERKLEDAYSYARDYLKLDIVSVTDHTPGREDWTETVEINEAFNDPGRFVTIPAWEWSGPHGHANIYLRQAAVEGGDPSVSEPDPWPSFGHFDIDTGEAPRLPQEHDWPDDAILVPHHPSTGGDHWGSYDWTVRNDRARLVEIVQGRGCHEEDVVDPEWGISHAGRGSSVRDALEMGHRIGFVAGTDNHWGFPVVHPSGAPETGLTCFLAASRTREAIWRAMDRRRTYATSGVPIRCHFAVNGAVMGSESTITPDEDIWFDAQLYGTAPIERVEIISDGECVWGAEPETADVTISSESLPRPDGPSAYYYLRLRQTDGHRAWISPVWLDERGVQDSG